MISSARTLAAVLALSSLTSIISFIGAKVHTVSPGGLQAALDKVSPGDTIKLTPGEYFETVSTTIDGEADKYITIQGETYGAILRGDKGAGSKRLFSVGHSYYRLDHFTIDGKVKDDYYFDKCLYVQTKGKKASEIHFNGHSFRSAINGLVISNMNVRNCGDECIRMRYFITYSQVYNNFITNCGVNDFVLNPNDGGKNGEGIYLGTSSNQWDDGKNPSNEPDESKFNHIFKNHFDTKGNEGVDIKEGSCNNIVEDNYCTGQKDPDSACLDSRGSSNIFRYNTIENNVGAGIRFGGHKVGDYTYGVDNEAYGNLVAENDHAGFSVMVEPQGAICHNNISGKSRQVVGAGEDSVTPTAKCGGNAEKKLASAFSASSTPAPIRSSASLASSTTTASIGSDHRLPALRNFDGGVGDGDGGDDDDDDDDDVIDDSSDKRKKPDINIEGTNRAVSGEIEKRKSLPVYDHLYESDFETPSI
ncbi:unnamed protein product [Ascophyllum nodosum]